VTSASQHCRDMWDGTGTDLIVGIDDGVGGHALRVAGLGPLVDGVNVREDGEHSAHRRLSSGATQRLQTWHLGHSQSCS